MLNIGIRAHDFGVLSPTVSASRIAESGAVCIQLALSKAHPSQAMRPSDLSPEELAEISRAYAEKNIAVAVLGSYINPVHPDQEAREQALLRFEDHLKAASSLGCSIVGTETGSRNPDCSFHPDTASEACFQDLVRSIRRLADFAEKTGSVRVGVEAVADQHTVSTAALMARLLKEVNSPAVGVIYDPVNLVPSTGVASQKVFIDECFDAFGEHIIAVHAKDYTITESCCGPTKAPSLPAGTGSLDWKAVLRKLDEYGKATVPILLEDIKPEHIPETITRINTLWNTRGN